MNTLVAPVPRRLLNISHIVEDFLESFESIKVPACLRWSSITFGTKELGLQCLQI